MDHKCEGCRYKSTHQEMMFRPTEVRTIYFDFEKPNKNNAINAWLEWLKQPAEGD